MRRFDYDDNDEYRREVDNFFGGGDDGDEGLTPEEYKSIVQDEKNIIEQQLNIAQQELNHRILRAAIRFVENSFWWRFYSVDTRLMQIEKVYRKLRRLEEVNAKV
jgi:hypothetical protein